MRLVEQPWSWRLNEHFVLSDFMYSDSIIRRGLVNKFDGGNETVISNCMQLAGFLEELVDQYGPVSVTYGYISPEVSMKTVKWRNPADPSYHRWDDGAAADVIFHDWVSPKRNEGIWAALDEPDASPMMLAREIAQEHDFSRMITYSESQSICIGVDRNSKPRRAFYENRWAGEQGKKPIYVTHRNIPDRETVRNNLTQHGWVGGGRPSYHLKGKQQYQHIRCGKYLTLLECLRDPYNLRYGTPNRPPTTKRGQKNFMRVAYAMSRFIEWYNFHVGLGSISVIAGHKCSEFFWALPQTGMRVHRTFENMLDWASGQGTMVFAIPDWYGREFRKEWQNNPMEDYFVESFDYCSSVYIFVKWAK